VSAAGELHRLHEASFARADGALRASWPPDRAMSAGELEAFLDEHTYCVLATATRKGRAQARPVAFTVFGGAFWFATVAGGRLRNVERTPWVSVVVTEGDGEEHRMVTADGPVTVVQEPPEGVLELWEARMGSRPAWAVAWIELRPEWVFSYTRA
jgi:nitroimidazol reductase NimA-like FMN-containing flavoprotein (pyridoxamine 5'-phosphate oxidase superfamily)